MKDRLLRFLRKVGLPVWHFVKSPGFLISLMVASGLTIIGTAFGWYDYWCDGGDLTDGWCRTVKDNPPWILLSGLATVPAVILTWWWRETHKREDIGIAQNGQVTERFTKAIEQLGSDQMAVRLGAIYALERIAKDSPSDHWTIVETLAAFIRMRAPMAEVQLKEPGGGEEAGQRKPEIDVQAALSVLGRRKTEFDQVGEGPDISNTDLPGVRLWGADLTWADLTGANLTGANLVRTNLTTADLSGANLLGAVLLGANLTRADLTGANLTAAKLDGANLSYADLPGANLTGANLTGANLTGANLPGIDLSGAPLSNARLSGSVLTGAFLSGADLTGADLSGATLFNVDLSGANLSGADLTGARLFGADLSKANLSGANLSLANLSKALLFDAILSNADLSNADLTGADLSGANLSGANLHGSVLSEAILTGVDLETTRDLTPAQILSALERTGCKLPAELEYLEAAVEEKPD